MTVRKAEEKDITRIIELLGQVLQIHADIRPDIFIPNTTKYTQTGGSFKTYAARKVSGTATSHINMESMIIPNLESPPPLKQPHMRQVLMPSPTRRQVVIIIKMPR